MRGSGLDSKTNRLSPKASNRERDSDDTAAGDLKGRDCRQGAGVWPRKD